MRALAASTLPVLRLVRTPQSHRRLARVMSGAVLVGAGLLLLTPWQQTSRGEGRVTAYSPLDRAQTIEAPIEGRVMRWYVQEGTRVAPGDPIADIADNDPELLSRMQNERDAVIKQLEAAKARVAAATSRIKAMRGGRRAATGAAAFRVKMAEDRVTAAEKAVEAATAALRTSQLNLKRQEGLVQKGLTSTRALELAQLEYAKASTDFDRARAAEALAMSEKLAIDSDRVKVGADTGASIDDARATLATAEAEVHKATAELTRLDTRLARQGAMDVKAPRAGTIHRMVARQGGEMVKAGDPLANLVPDVTDHSVELWVDGRDIPLLRIGGEVRLQFEGWPAVQFSGWPSVAVGTFGGRVMLVDPTDDGTGKFRVVVKPDDGEPWPNSTYLRQGVRAHGWLLLGRVPLGYELWRQFNGFPPTVPLPSELGKAADAGKKAEGGKDGK